VPYIDKHYPESRFGGFSDIDGTVRFYSRVNALTGPDAVLLDIGCGRGRASEDPVAFRRQIQTLKGKCARVIGIDVSPAGRNNPQIDEFRLIQNPNGGWPVPDASVDLCLADSVLEHIEKPDHFFSECQRVLKPGGYVCLRTPNVRSYVGLATRLVPNRYHARVLGKAQVGRKEEDIFPTFLACNTPGRVRRKLSEHGFDHRVYAYDAEPSYLGFSAWAFALGVFIRRLTPAPLRTVIFAFAQKTPSL
jgi:SAM-dependent methyltransferase